MSAHKPKGPTASHLSVVDQTPRTGPVSMLESVEAILSYEGTYGSAKAIPAHGLVGRPRDYPDFMYVVYEALISVFRSSRKVETELAHPLLWNHMRRIVKKRFPKDRSMWLPAEPMRRHHYRHALRYLRDAEGIDDRTAVFRGLAVDVALEIGLLSPDGPKSITHPDLANTIQADGKVVTPVFRAKPGETRIDKETGEVIPKRCDPDGSLHVEGGGIEAWGSKYVIASARTEELRVILDVEFVPAVGDGGEAGVAVDVIKRIAAAAPGMHAVNYDGAWRGVHMDAAIRAGVIPVVPPRAADVTKVGKKTLAKSAGDKLIQTKDVTINGKTTTVELHAYNGALCLRELDEAGSPVFFPLDRVRTQRIKNADGSFRMYSQYRLPKEYGGVEVSVPHHITDEDRKRGLNRTEHLRVIPTTDPDFKRLYARRKDIESINRGLEDSFFLGRAHSVGHVAQQADLLGFGLMINALSLHRHRLRASAEAAA